MSDKKNQILEVLNPQQAKAVEHAIGPLFILAGAGTGKTRVITHRIAYLIEERDIRPFNILALTFTNKAAGEMKERVADLVGESSGGSLICTFHSFCNYVLRRDIDLLRNFKRGFSIYDETDSRNCIKSILKQLELPADKTFSPAAIHSIISKAKNFDGDPLDYVDQHAPLFEFISTIDERYRAVMEHSNALDFDDLLIKVIELFRGNPEVLDKYRHRFAHVLVDEYQDTNTPQYEIMKMLGAPGGNVTVVGDLDQSIYGWRGANVSNMFSFEKDFDNVRVIALEQNYRSKQNILDAANELISHNRGIGDKHLWSELGPGEKPFLITPWDEREEAEFITMEIDHLLMEGYRLSDIAVMFRTKAQSRVLEETFLKAVIPYCLIGATAFYQRREIKDVIAYLRVLENPRDMEAFSRVANVPRRGIGPKTLEKILEPAVAAGSLFDLVGKGSMCENELPKKAVQLIKTLKTLSSRREKISIDKLIDELLHKTGYMAYLDELIVSEGVDTRKENVGELVSLAAEYTRDSKNPSLDGFLSRIALVSDTDVKEFDDEKARLITLHSAKGLEFPAVFIAGVEENLLPHKTSIEENPEVEEERRLCYVGITRARELLYLSCCRSRFRFGSVMHNAPSRFIFEIGEERIQLLASPRGGGSGGSFFDGEPDDEEEKSGYFRTEQVDAREESDSGGGIVSGDYVVHEYFGEGRVISVDGRNI
ncbi:ATP-dependent helicase, partial [bacterium]